MENMGELDSFNNLWKNRPVLVTGGAGFIGSWLADALIQRGAEVLVLDKKETIPQLGGHYEVIRSKTKYIRGDVKDEKALKDIFSLHQIVTVFHLAAETQVGDALLNPKEALDTNIRGTWNILEIARQIKTHPEVILASSDKAYGSHPTLPYTEDFSLEGRSPYDCSKSCADLIAQMYAQTYGVPVCVTRCGNVYGGGDLNFSRLVPGTIRSLLKNERPEIRSDGFYLRDYNFINDIVSAYITAAEALIGGKIKNGVFNFGTGKSERVIDVVSKIIKFMGVPLEPMILSSAEHEIKDQYLDATKARKVLGWHPEVSLEDGLRHTVIWYQDVFKKYGQSLTLEA